MRQVKIFCPKCDYVPQPSDLWSCVPTCGCLWNTFETCGICPKCGKNWEDTACPRCSRWSPHVDWYHEIVPDETVETNVEVPATEPAGRLRAASFWSRGQAVMKRMSPVFMRPLTGAQNGVRPQRGLPQPRWWSKDRAIRVWGVLVIALLLVAGMAGCKSKIVRPEAAIAIEGWINTPGHYIIPARPDVSIKDLVRLADGLPLYGLHEIARGRKIGAELSHEEGDRKVSVKPEQWSVPLRDLKIDVRHYNRLQITITPLR